MESLFRIPLLFFFLASCMGVLLRTMMIFPIEGFTFPYLLHGHSHVMFLGWVFNVLFLAYAVQFIPTERSTIYKRIFWILQMLVIGMFISFPLQGYGTYSIIFSSVHTIISIVFTVNFFVHTKGKPDLSVWLAKISLLFLAISAFGPFYLGYLKASGHPQSDLNQLAIYFYLHFQYNGFFFFGVLCLFFSLLEKKRIDFNQIKAKRLGMILALTCVPAYVLSVLWTSPGYIFNVIGGIVAMIQLFAIVILVKLLKPISNDLKRNFSSASIFFLCIVFTGFALKLCLQFASAFPFVAQMAFELRPLVIAYLHLVLVGVISLLILVWYLETGRINAALAKNAIILFVISFIAMELGLVLSPWWSRMFGTAVTASGNLILMFSVGLSFSCFLLFISFFRKRL